MGMKFSCRIYKNVLWHFICVDAAVDVTVRDAHGSQRGGVDPSGGQRPGGQPEVQLKSSPQLTSAPPFLPWYKG